MTEVWLTPILMTQDFNSLIGKMNRARFQNLSRQERVSNQLLLNEIFIV